MNVSKLERELGAIFGAPARKRKPQVFRAEYADIRYEAVPIDGRRNRLTVHTPDGRQITRDIGDQIGVEAMIIINEVLGE